MEEWKDIKGYERLYQVSNTGRIKSLAKGKIRKLQKNRYGYLMVGLYKNGISKYMTVHRIVANAFIPNSQNKPEVNHKNGIKTDNRVENLEWVTSQENVLHSFRELGRKGKSNNKGKLGKLNWLSKEILQFDSDGNLIKKWCGIRDVTRSMGIDEGSISKCCSGIRKTAGGYLWKYC